MNKLLYAVCCFFTNLSTTVYAQTGSVRGNVFDKETGEPIISGTIRIQGTTIGTNTNVDGFFSLTNIDAGSYKLVATYIGYDSLVVDIRIESGGITYKSMYMMEGGVELDIVQVSAEKEKARNEVRVSTVRVTPKQIKALPSTGGEADIAQYLPVLPGIVFTGDQGGQLYIRGGSPIQNKILLDGMTIYNPFHSIGFFSVFETEAIRSVDVLTGGFNAEYGGRISAIVDIKTKEGNKKRMSGVVSANPFLGKVLLEGPIKKLEEGGGSTSFIFTGKHSYINETSTIFYPYAADTSLYNFSGADTTINKEDLGLPYSFTDLYGKLSFVAPNGSKLNLFGFNFKDKVDFTGFANLEWKNFGAGADFTLVPATSSMIVGGNVTYSNYEIQLIEKDDAPRFSSINSFTAGLDFTYFGRNNEFKYGFELNGFSTNFRFQNFLGIIIEQEDFTTELSGFFKYRQKFNKLIVEPSVRFQYYASLSDFSVEPRLGLKYNATGSLRFKFAGGIYSQNLISTVNERDVVNLFVGFLSGPEETIYKPGTTEKTSHNLQKAIHGIFGIEYDLTKNIEVNVEPYYKKFTQLINVNRNKLVATDPNYATETGDAYGIDFSLKFENKSTYVWLTYSYAHVNRDDGFQVYPTIFDRRHNINALITYSFGSDMQWEASGRWNMGSGFPFTQTAGFYENEIFQDGLNTDILTNNGELGIVYSENRNGGRLPYYHRLDLSFKRIFTFSKYSKLEIIASVTNAYNRENIFFVDRVTNSRVNQLPILPSLGIVFSF